MFKRVTLIASFFVLTFSVVSIGHVEYKNGNFDLIIGVEKVFASGPDGGDHDTGDHETDHETDDSGSPEPVGGSDGPGGGPYTHIVTTMCVPMGQLTSRIVTISVCH
jgi:hypothetical protein